MSFDGKFRESFQHRSTRFKDWQFCHLFAPISDFSYWTQEPHTDETYIGFTLNCVLIRWINFFFCQTLGRWNEKPFGINFFRIRNAFRLTNTSLKSVSRRIAERLWERFSCKSVVFVFFLTSVIQLITYISHITLLVLWYAIACIDVHDAVSWTPMSLNSLATRMWLPSIEESHTKAIVAADWAKYS